MKTHLFTNISIILTTLLVSVSGHSFSPPENPPTPSLLISINQSEYRSLMGKRYEAFNFIDTASHDTLCPIFVDPIMLVSDFITAYKERTPYTGIRIYPGLTSSKRLVSILCLANDTTTQEGDYRMFVSADYTLVPFPAAGDTLPETPLQLHQRYINEILIYAERQPNYGNDDSKFRKSRYYAWTELYDLMNQNIPGFNINDSSTYYNYRIQIETGFVSGSLVETFHNRLNLGNRNYHYGYTVMLHVLDSVNNGILNTSGYRDPSEPYKNRYLEIGHPCPPLCGVLHD